MTVYTYKQKTWSKLPGEFRGVRPMTEKRFLQLGGKIKRDNKEGVTQMNMTVHDLNGNEFDITKDEAERIADELARLNHSETNEAFLNRALDNIQGITGVRPRTEDDLKVLLYQNTSNTNMHDINLIYEAVEAIVGWHKKKVG